MPDAATAIALSEKTLVPVYGKKQIESERPFKAKLEGSVWHVWGYMPPEDVGGVAEVWIDKNNGKVIRMSHGK